MRFKRRIERDRRHYPLTGRIRLVLLAAAVTVAAVPRPAEWVERAYSHGIYPWLQLGLTSATNLLPIAAGDILLLLAIIWLATASVAICRQARRDRSWRPVGRGLLAAAAMMALIYLWFVAAWGLNYARPSLRVSLPFDAARVTDAEVLQFAEKAVQQVNARFAGGSSESFDAHGTQSALLVASLRRVERALGRPAAFVAGQPKPTLLTSYFRASGTDGMTVPFTLEILLNPDLTGPERPIVLAHEWAHLNGRAAEDEASFVAVIAALQADERSRYSAWLSLVLDLTAQLPASDARQVLAQLADGPRRDRERIYERLAARVQAVQVVGAIVYDRYLKSQGVDAGVRSYGQVIELLVGLDPAHPWSWRNL